MDSINGINIERYAWLYAKMNNVLNDKEACLKIAESEGISKTDWEAANKGWQERITDPLDVGKTASLFDLHWKAAIESLKPENEKLR